MQGFTVPGDGVDRAVNPLDAAQPDLLFEGDPRAKSGASRSQVTAGLGVAGAVLAFNGLLASAVMVSYTVTYNSEHELGWFDRMSRVILDPGDYVQGVDLGKDTHLTFIEDASHRRSLLYGSLALCAVSVAVLILSCRAVTPFRDRLSAPLHRTARVALPVCRKEWTAPRTTLVAWLVQGSILLWLIWPPYKCYYIGDSDDEECGHPWPPPIGDVDTGGDLTYYSHHLGAAAMQCTALAFIPIPKHSILLPVFGIPFERAIFHHRQFGRFAVLLALAHGVFTCVDWESTTNAFNIGHPNHHTNKDTNR